MPITFEHVSYNYNPADAKKRGASIPQALDDVSLTIPDGQFLAIIGHTGSGKSTLVQHMNGLLQPTSGRVLVDGLDLAEKANRRAVRRYVGLTFQYPEYQLFANTVAEDVAFGPRNLGVDEDEVQRRVRSALDHLGLSYGEVGQQSPFELSGGQQRRVAIAGALAMHPKVLVLDEPMAGLDPQGRVEIMQHVHELHDELGLTIVMVTHSMEDVAENAQSVLVLNRGRVFMHGTPAEVFSHAAELHDINLGVPRATKFADELRGRGFPLPPDIITLEQLADAIASRIGPRTKEQYLALMQAGEADGGERRG